MPLFPVPLIHATVAPLLLPDYPTQMSISATMWLSPSCSHLPCYLQDRGEIADDVIITKPRNRYVKITVLSVHPLTVPSGINPRATGASIKVLFRGIKASIHTRPLSRLDSRHFALPDAVFQPHVGQTADFFSLTLL